MPPLPPLSSKGGEGETAHLDIYDVLLITMLLLKWIIRMLVDLVKFGIANRAMGMSLAVITLLFLGIVIIAAKVTAPFIYTLF